MRLTPSPVPKVSNLANVSTSEPEFQPDAQLEHRTLSRTVSVDAQRCIAVATDFAAYPEWADGLEAVEISETDDQGRAIRVQYSVAGLGRKAQYELRYDYSQVPDQLSWTMVEGDVTRRLDGAYKFKPSQDVVGGTDITYDLTVDLAVPLPGFVKRRVEAKILSAALERFAARAESGQ